MIEFGQSCTRVTNPIYPAPVPLITLSSHPVQSFTMLLLVFMNHAPPPVDVWLNVPPIAPSHRASPQEPAANAQAMPLAGICSIPP